MTTLFRKWWVILAQGILLIIIGFIFFNNPVQVLVVISLWVGILTLAMGVIGLIAHFTTRTEGNDNNLLWWSIASLLIGLAMVARPGLTMKALTVIFGLWVLLTGVWLISAGWTNRKSGLPGWIMLLGGVLSVFAGIAIVFNIGMGAVWISTLLGIQAIISGVGLIMLALLKRSVVRDIRNSLAR